MSASSFGLNRGPRIAVIYATGAIVGGRSGYDPLNGALVGSETLIEYIRQARKDSSVRAIVLRIDSPGGSASASDAIWRELTIARNERADRPLVASMSDLAASGGYYIAMPAHVIVAQPSTLTGSIGIFGGKVVTGGVYEKLGARIESTSIGRHAEINSPARPYNPAEVKKLQEQLQSFYDDFVEKVADVTALTPEEIDALAQGRVWTGRQAKQNKLIDELGARSRRRARETAREDSRREWRRDCRLPAAEEFLRARDRTALRLGGRVGRLQPMAQREPVERGARRAADDAWAAVVVQARRSARPDAVYVLSVRSNKAEDSKTSNS